MSQLDLSDRVALVTGAVRGIGLASVRRLLDAGAMVAMNVRRRDAEAEAVISELKSAHGDAVSVLEGDASDPAFAKTAIRQIFNERKRLDILVNNAGILRDNYIGMIPDDEIDAIMRANVHSVFHMTQAAARLLGRSPSGSIVNLASIIGRRGNAGQFIYGASKAAVIGATLSAAKELAAKNIRVNAIAPGYIETRMTESLDEPTRARLVGSVGLGRAGQANDIADVVLFLASDLSRYVTGQIIGVDGGMII